MIIINEYTEKALTERLENIQKESKHARCIHLKFQGANVTANAATPTIQQYVEANIESIEQYQLFLCEDGDAYLIGNSIATKDISFFIKYLADSLGIDIKTNITVYELPAQAYHVLTSIDEKIQNQTAVKKEDEASIQENIQKKKRSSILSVVNEENAKSTIINTRKNRSKPQIMVVEDDAFTRQLVLNLLRKQYPIEGTGVPIEALQMYVRLAPEVLFLDINLPDVTGHELLTRILELDPNACVVMLSGNMDKENVTKAIGEGAKGFVGKPFTKEKLLQYIEKRLGA